MGTYYRIVCEEHNEVLDLNTSDDLNNELKEFIMENHLTDCVYDGGIYGNCTIKLSPVLNKIIKESTDCIFGEKQKNVLLAFMRKHQDCDLTFQPDEPFDEEIRKDEGWKWYDIFGDVT